MSVLSKSAPLSLAFLLAAGAQAADTKEVHRTVAIDRDGRVLIDTYKGSIAVKTWDRPEVRVDALIEPDGDCRDSREKVQWTEVHVSGSGGFVDIKTDYDRIKHHRSGFLGLFDFETGPLPFVRYTIQMPATVRLEIKDYKSGITVSDLKADLRLHTYKGTVKVTNLDGAARVDTYKGDVQVAFAKFSRASRFDTHKGDIDVRLPKESRFDLDADTGRRGDLDSDFATTTRAGHWRSARSARSAGAVNGGGPELRLTTYKGTLKVRSS